MDSNAGAVNNGKVYDYNIVAGSTKWFLNLEAIFDDIEYCPSYLDGIKV